MAITTPVRTQVWPAQSLQHQDGFQWTGSWNQILVWTGTTSSPDVAKMTIDNFCRFWEWHQPQLEDDDSPRHSASWSCLDPPASPPSWSRLSGRRSKNNTNNSCLIAGIYLFAHLGNLVPLHSGHPWRHKSLHKSVQNLVEPDYKIIILIIL